MDLTAPVTLVCLPEHGDSATPRSQPVLDAAPVLSNDFIGEDHWRLRLRSKGISRRALPGQFVMLTLARSDEWLPMLPRPMALFSWSAAGEVVEIVYRVVGEGTRILSTWRTGEIMSVVGPLGGGFRLARGSTGILLLGRGIGTCSLTALAGVAEARGVAVHAVSSGRNPSTLFASEFYKAIPVASLLEVTDQDGSSEVGALWVRLQALIHREPIQQIFVCGSRRLLDVGAALGREAGASVQVALEAHMACGLGYCHGCSTGYPGLALEAPLVCKDGPVFMCAD